MNINTKALKYFHRLKRQGYVHPTARNSTLFMFSKDFEDYARRTQKYINICIYPEFMEFGVENVDINHGTEGEIIRARDRKANPRFRL